MEGTTKWLVTGFEPLGMVKHGRSIRLPSAKSKMNKEIKIFYWAMLSRHYRTGVSKVIKKENCYRIYLLDGVIVKLDPIDDS